MESMVICEDHLIVHKQILTWPHNNTPTPKNIHHNHCSALSLTVWNATPPNSIMRTFKKGKQIPSNFITSKKTIIFALYCDKLFFLTDFMINN